MVPNSKLEYQFYVSQLYEATLLTEEERDQIAEKIFAEKLPYVSGQQEQQSSEQQQSS